MKKIFLFPILQCLALCTYGQVLFSHSSGNVSLQSYTAAGSPVTQYTNAPATFSLINDTLDNSTGSLSNPNRPFNVPSLKNTGWATVFNATENDTFLVSTSWVDDTLRVDRWIITPLIPNIGANTVLTWLAKSPDSSFPDGYEVYGTNKTTVLTPTDFAIGDRLFYIADGNTSGQGEKSSWTRHSIDLSGFAGQTLRFAFRNNSKNMYQIWIDDIEVVKLPNALDMTVSGIITNKYVLSGSSNTVNVKVANMGAAAVTTLEVKYTINNTFVNSSSFNFTDALLYRQGASLALQLPYTITLPGFYTLKSWISAVNGTADQNQANDTAYYNITVLGSIPSHNVMVEQFVSANNGDAPDAHDKTYGLQASGGIVVNIHDGDSLKEAGSATLIADYKSTYATALMNRSYQPDLDRIVITRPDYNNRFNLEQQRLSPAIVSIHNKSYNAATRELSFTVKAGFAGEVKGDYRINAYLTENNVCGPYNDTTINGYNQLNNSYNVSWASFYHQGYYSPVAGTYVIDALHYKHQNTLVHAFNGAYGLPGVIPANGGTQGQAYQETFTLTLPTPTNTNVHKFNPDNIYIVGFVAEYNSDKNKRTVLNAAREKLTSNPEFVGIAEAANNSASFSVYPNPSDNGLFYVNSSQNSNYSLAVYDLFGKCLKTESGTRPGVLDLSAFADGIYILTFRSGNAVTTEKIVIQKN